MADGDQRVGHPRHDARRHQLGRNAHEGDTGHQVEDKPCKGLPLSSEVIVGILLPLAAIRLGFVPVEAKDAFFGGL